MTNTAIARSWKNRTVAGMSEVTRCTLHLHQGDQYLLLHDEDLAEELQAEFSVVYSDVKGCHVLKLDDEHVLLLARLEADGILERPEPQAVRAALGVIKTGVGGAPWRVRMTQRTKEASSHVKKIPGVSWEPTTATWLCSVGTRRALTQLVGEGLLQDPQGLLTTSEDVHTLWYDNRQNNSGLRVLGEPRADRVLAQHFPTRDVVSEWREKGVPVEFGDSFTQEVYEGELARHQRLQPNGMAVELYDYQQQSVAVAVVRSGLVIADEPGLGKTPSAIGIGYELRQNRGVGTRNVVICPPSVRSQWVAEIHRFCGPGQHVVKVDGDKTARARLYAEARDADWVIVHYGHIRTDFDQIAPLVDGAILFADEVHRFRNPTTKQAQAGRKLALRACRRYGFTGTPLTSNIDELHSILSGFVLPGLLGKFEAFAARYMYKARWGGYYGARRESELHQRTAPHIMRHLKRDVVPDLPPLVIQRLALDPGDRLRRALTAAHAAAEAELQEAKHWVDDENDASAMTAIGQLRRMCISPRLVRMSEADAADILVSAGLVPDVDGPKLDWVREHVQGIAAAGERIVLFTTSKTMAKLVADRLDDDGIESVLYTGDTKSQARDEAVARFIDPDDAVTAFIATDAAAEGLNLGRCCSELVNIDLPWNPSVLTQRANRIHRVDTTHASYRVTNLTIQSTMEDGMVKLLEKRAALADAVLGETNRPQQATGKRITQADIAEVTQALLG